ncbi:LytTR family DNA-binding domain-containing protein [Tenacibaculum sp. 190524A02b]|uniref:LytR/AlgR family response regulator transcription factor n=1 Tax=Tenacibaculum vairaonense TaxID=3137860 RepID=UPI0031FB0E06
MPIKCILIDDEPPAITLLEKYISAFSDIEIIATCNSAISASEILKKESVDLIFLDIQMPVLTGLDFLKSKSNLPKVILTTAHRKYALESYDLDVVDYLLKPISFDRFFKAIERFYRQIPQHKHQFISKLQVQSDYMFVNINKKHHKINFDSILYIESLKDYIRIHLSDTSYVVKNNIGTIEKELPKNQFIRVHRSYIVALDKITAYTSMDIEINQIEIPIGQTYKHEVIKFIK